MNIENITLIAIAINTLIILFIVFLRNPKRTEIFTTEVAYVKKDISSKIEELRDLFSRESRENRKEQSEVSDKFRKDIQELFEKQAQANKEKLTEISDHQSQQLAKFEAQLKDRLSEVANSQNSFEKKVTEQNDLFGRSLGEKISNLVRSQEENAEKMRDKLDEKLKNLSDENSRRIDEMRKTVDEKLQTTLERRLTEQFKLVGDRLDQVHKGLGEMQNLAGSVGDLKRTLTNVKARGTWAEAQLDALISDMLTPDQYIKNAKVDPKSDETVEFAIRLPGRDDDGDQVLLAVDSKFPREDYERLMNAADDANPDGVAQSTRDLIKNVKKFAKTISDKYIKPPSTTDFAIMYLPTEGLYGEIVRQPGLVDELQREFRVTVTGPSTFSAFLSALQMGFKTLAIEKRSSEVWKVLGGVKAEFGKFGDVIMKVKKKLDAASSEIEQVGVRTRAIDRKLRDVEAAPDASDVAQLDVEELLGLEHDPDGTNGDPYDQI